MLDEKIRGNNNCLSNGDGNMFDKINDNSNNSR